MNTQELKVLMIEKDNEVKLREEKTIEYFNLVKDDVVSDLIRRFISNEFKRSEFIHESIVVDILYKKLGISTEGFTWIHPLYSEDWSYIRYAPVFLDYQLGIPSHDHPNAESIMKNYSKAININDSFNYKEFGRLIEEYVLSKGFKNRMTNNFHGQKVKFGFIASRKHIEMLINNPNYIAKERCLSWSTSPTHLYLWVAALLIIALTLNYLCK